MMPSGRKRWNLHDGPQGSLRRLRNQLAEDGCAESQVVLAKQLLEEKCELEADKISNFKQALEWLICATEQAHPEARRMLRRCIRSGVIDEQSSYIVRAKSCLAASRQETVARKAARDLFASLSNGEQYITTAQLERRIREICNTTLRDAGDDSDTPDDDAEVVERALGAGEGAEGDGGGGGGGGALEGAEGEGEGAAHGNGTLRPRETGTHQHDYPEKDPPSDVKNLTVDNLVSAAVDYCQGELPLVSRDLTLTDPGLTCLDHIPLLQQAFLHPIVFIQVLYLKLLYYFGSFRLRLSNTELALLLAGYLSLNAENIFLLVPVVMYYASFAAMVICTFKMLHAKRQFIDFRKWSGLFLRYSDGNLHPDESENLFVQNNIGPFLQFFAALLINLLLYPFIATQWVLFSELCVLSFFFMFLTLFSFNGGNLCPDVFAFLSFGINVLAKYPYENDSVVNQGWRFLDLHISNYPFYILGSSIEFCLNSRVLFALLIPLIILYMAKRDNWKGVFKYAIPHCVTLSWLQMFIMASHGCTTYGLIRGTLGLVCTCLCVPLVGLATVTLPIFACVQCLALSRVVYTAVVVLGLAVTLAVTCVMAKSNTMKKFVTPLQLITGFATLIYLGNQCVTNIQDDGLPSTIIDLFGDEKQGFKNLLKNEFMTDYEDNSYYVSWEDYYKECHNPSWEASNMAATQIKCAVLDGTHVNWDGQVQEVKLHEVKNRWNDVAEWLPGVLREYFKCYYGDEYMTLCGEGESETEHMDRSECEFVKRVARQGGKSCHLHKHNEYTYEIALSLPSVGGGLLGGAGAGGAARVRAGGGALGNITRALRRGDHVRVRGALHNTHGSFDLGSRDVHISAHELSCVQCARARGSARSPAPAAHAHSSSARAYRAAATHLARAGKYALNFILNPVLVFK